MAANFTWEPTWVTPQPPKFTTIITEAESFMKDHQLIDNDSVSVYNLQFDGVTDSNRNSIVSHFYSASGAYDSFTWTTVPSYLNAGTTMTVRYVKGSYSEKPRARYWEISFAFEEDI